MKSPKLTGSKTGLKIVDYLLTLDGAMPYHGDASWQVIFKLANGKTLRLGVTDDDVAQVKGLWIDQYEGLTKSEVKFFKNKK
jgi:hypothetical protein